MQKTMKRTLVLILAVMLCLSGLPYSAFATEAPPDEPISSQAPPSEAPAESSQPEPSAGPDVVPQPDLEATPGPENSPESDAAAEPSPVHPAEASPSPSPSAQPDSPYETELAQVDATQIWSSLQRARTRAAAGAGTAGVLQMGYYCFKSDVGTLTTLGEYVSQMPAKTMLINGTNIAAYCLEHEKGATGGTPYSCWETYIAKLRELTINQLSEQATEIAAAALCYGELRNISWQKTWIEYFNQVEDPLAEAQKAMLTMLSEETYRNFDAAMWGLMDQADLERGHNKEAAQGQSMQV